jgi:hypothetical protein
MNVQKIRARTMQRWWGLFPLRPWWLRPVQNAVGRLGCLVAGHEQGRAWFCDWCGKDLG